MREDTARGVKKVTDFADIYVNLNPMLPDNPHKYV
ncbi:hypothetical protein PhaeoP72_00481 [Phaeobacter inhibens]|nr:hypothetical protein PhaeoP72_00481 [Phaeobacter inhibens]